MNVSSTAENVFTFTVPPNTYGVLARPTPGISKRRIFGEPIRSFTYLHTANFAYARCGWTDSASTKLECGTPLDGP